MRYTRFCLIAFLASIQVLSQGTEAQTAGDSTKNEPSITEPSSLFFYHQYEYPRDCKEVRDQCPSSAPSDVYVIKPNGYLNPIEVYCDDSAESEGWTVIQRRQINGTVEFNRDWDSYKLGFGFLSHEFWIGNKILSFLTNQKKYELLIEVTTSEGLSSKQSYNNFCISDEFSEYKLLSAVHQPASLEYITWCPNNMIYGNCTCGQSHCRNPAQCQDTCDGDLTESCICPDGYHMQEGYCVPDHQCRCYFPEEQHIVPEDTTYVNNACTSLVACSNGEMVRNDTYQCSPDAVCKEREGVRKCYRNFGYAGDGVTCTPTVMGMDCQAAYDAGYTESGVYPIKPTNWPGTTFDVYCNMTADGEGWTVFQRRINGTVDFNIYWDDYEEGFGTIDHEYWLGNRKLHYLTSQRNYKLRIDMVLKDGSPKYAEYELFEINDESDNYRLSSLGTFSGNIGYDRFAYNRNQQFTTRDRDNDANSINCAIYASYFRGGWWYNYCSDVNLNGIYGAGDCSIESITWRNEDCSLCNIKYTEMKIRPI